MYTDPRVNREEYLHMKMTEDAERAVKKLSKVFTNPCYHDALARILAEAYDNENPEAEIIWRDLWLNSQDLYAVLDKYPKWVCEYMRYDE